MQLAAKAERQRLIESVVSRKRVGTQLELLDALADAGCVVTQATVSRDIRELGLEKTHDALGRPRYVAARTSCAATDPREIARTRCSRQFGRRSTPRRNIVVVRSELGSAPGDRARARPGRAPAHRGHARRRRHVPRHRADGARRQDARA